MFITEWERDIHNFPVLRSYVHFKSNFEMEEYLCNIRDYSLRKIMSRFRLSSHNLQIEIGRHLKPKQLLHERLCKQCNLNVIESEEHFLLYCPYYHEERVVLFTKILFCDDAILSEEGLAFPRLLQSKDDDIIFSVSKYIKKCFKKREQP